MSDPPRADDSPGADDPSSDDRAEPAVYRPRGLAFRTRLTVGLIVAAVLPVTAFGAVVVLLVADTDDTVTRVLLLAIALAVAFAVLLAALLAADLGAPLRQIASSVDRVTAGDLGTRLELPGDDEFSRLADSHNRLAADLDRRNRELRRLLDALSRVALGDRPDTIATDAAAAARDAFGMIDCDALIVNPREIPEDEVVPGDPVPVRAVLAAGARPLGILVGRLPATRRWDRADQDLLDLFAIEIAGAMRNAELYAQVEDQNQRLVELDRAKDDFLRGVSHNLQTPLASIRAYAGRLEEERPDQRLEIIVEQADRLSRMVRQLLTVSRLESGALRSRLEVFAVAARVRRTWDALGEAEVPFTLRDESGGWLALGDPDQLDQVLWALLDNAVTHGRRSPIEAAVTVDPAAGELRVTIADHGPGVADEDRIRLFGRFERGTGRLTGEGSGLGLYVSRELCRSMGGELEIAPAQPGLGAQFVITLPAETPEEA